ncbi:MAG: ABC transporter permease [Candidatus Dormibacteraeota bacterium]|nr:ABC transporter permease [Candidatus Dormibacteraeota bacterium]
MTGVLGDLVYESFYLGRRTLLRFFRVPANWLSIILFPLIQLFVFSQLFKDIVQLPGFHASGSGSYLAYLAPGQIAFTAFFAVAWSGSAILVEYRNGYIDKLRVTPIHRVSILVGELAPLFFESAIMAGGILAMSVVLGATIKTGVIGAALILVLSGLFGMAWAGTSFVPALLTKSEQATGTLSLLLFPIAFMSTAFVPPALMPAWLQAVNIWNPITFVIEAIRPLMVSGYDWAAIGKALVAIALLGLVLQSATLWAFRRLTA